MRRSSPLDLSTYGRAIPLLVRNPELTVVPFLSGLIGVAITRFLSPSADILGLGQLIQFLLDAFALAVSIILADMAWRYGRGSFDDAWTDARRKAGDILLSAIGGVPGGASLQVSIDRVRSAPTRAIVLTVVFLVLYFGTLLGPFYLGFYGTVALLVGAVLKAIVLGYIALVMAKTYTDGAFGSYY